MNKKEQMEFLSQYEDFWGHLSDEEKEFVCQNYRPRCICKDGLNVLDDVGGMWGYRDFLVTIHEGSEEEREEIREWARYLGWTGRNVNPKNVL